MNVSQGMKDGDGIFLRCTPLQKCLIACSNLVLLVIFSGHIGERALKGIVKDHAACTQKQPGYFAEQCAIRECENNFLKYVMTDLDDRLGVRKSGVKKTLIKVNFVEGLH
jgi:hypothetical protein